MKLTFKGASLKPAAMPAKDIPVGKAFTYYNTSGADRFIRISEDTFLQLYVNRIRKWSLDDMGVSYHFEIIPLEVTIEA